MTGSIRAFVANQVNVAILRFLGLKCAPCKILKCAPRIGYHLESNVPHYRFYMAKLDEICYQVCFSSCRDWYLTRQNPEFQNPAIGGV